MNRRQWVRTLAGGLLLPSTAASMRAQEPDTSTPAAVPPHHGLPRPVVLGDGIELIDYRIYPSTDVPRMIGEIVNTGNVMIDSPVVSVVFPDLGVDGLAYAPPFLPVMRPGESNLIFGVLPNEIDSEDKLASADFGLCGPVVSGEQSRRFQDRDLELLNVTDEHWETAQIITGELRNNGSEVVELAQVQGLVRDANGRLAGVTPSAVIGDILPGTAAPFAFWSAIDIPIPANPYVLLAGSHDYATQLFPGSVTNHVLPGCPSIYPWSDRDD